MFTNDRPFQMRVHSFVLTCFGGEIAYDMKERGHRFLEESIELYQAVGCTKEDAHTLVDYVFNRPTGEASNEVGGVMVTLAALCNAANIDHKTEAETELTRIWGIIEKIRAKHQSKPMASPLPGITQTNDQ